MAQSRQCMQCKYSGRMHSGVIANWKNDLSCDYFIKTGKLDDKGDDVEHCKLFELRTRAKRRITNKYDR